MPVLEMGWSARPRVVRRVLLVAPLLVMLFADRSGASSYLCDTLGAAKLYNVLGTKKVTAAPGSPAGELYGRPPETGPICAPQETLLLRSVVGDIVATSAKGTAIAFRRLPSNNESSTLFANGIVTAGGRVRLTGREQYTFVDNSGTHPDLASCTAAMADATAASNAFAALPPTQTFGDFYVPPDPTSSNFVNITANGSPREVLNFHSLRLGDGPSTCWLFGGSGGLLSIRSDTATEIVINVATNFHLGNCALIELLGPERAVINVIGKGPQIIVGQSADVGYQTGILAPQRTVVTLDGFGEATYLRQVWAQSVTLKGHIHAYSPMCDGASPSGAFIDGPVAY